MLTPDGQSADKIEKVMLLAMWANSLNVENKAGLGKPSFPVPQAIIDAHIKYWQRIAEIREKWYQNPEKIPENPAIDYGDPRGELPARTLMAQSLNAEYKLPAEEVKPENVLFTVGGIAGLKLVWDVFNARYSDLPGYRVITPFPHYSAYANNTQHRLHPIPVMETSGYRLTAEALEASIKEAYELAKIDGWKPKAVLICNPSNPLGSVIDREEFVKIAQVLRKYVDKDPDLKIVIDGAYDKMSFVEITSLLEIEPALKERLIFMESATKAFSAAGERMAALVAFDPKLMSELIDAAIKDFIHAPVSAQIAYAEAMVNFNETEHKEMLEFYQKKVKYVMQRLQEMGAAMSDPAYQVQGTFYALGDFSDLLGMDLPGKAKEILQKEGKVSTGEDIAYYLLCNELMVTPLSYLGLPKDCGFMRITCSANEEKLKELMAKLEQQLLKARQQKYSILLQQSTDLLNQLRPSNEKLYSEYLSEYMKITFLASSPMTCKELADKNRSLTGLLSNIRVAVAQHSIKGRENAARIIQTSYRKHRFRGKAAILAEQLEKDWRVFVDTLVSNEPINRPVKNLFLRLNPKDRLAILPWKNYLEQKYITEKPTQKPIINPTSSTNLESLKVQFFNLHDKMLAQEKSQCFIGFFRRTKINRGMSLEQIVEHALAENNRSRRVFKALRWFSDDNKLINKEIMSNLSPTPK